MSRERVTKKALEVLKLYKEELTFQQFRTLRGQILSGNAEGAMKGLGRLLEEK